MCLFNSFNCTMMNVRCVILSSKVYETLFDSINGITGLTLSMFFNFQFNEMSVAYCVRLTRARDLKLFSFSLDREWMLRLQPIKMLIKWSESFLLFFSHTFWHGFTFYIHRSGAGEQNANEHYLSKYINGNEKFWFVNTKHNNRSTVQVCYKRNDTSRWHAHISFHSILVTIC